MYASVALPIVLLAVSASPATVEEIPVPQRLRVGIVTDGPDTRENNFVKNFKIELVRASSGRYDIEFPADATLDGSWDQGLIAERMESLADRSDIDVIVAIGVGASQTACEIGSVQTPVVVPFNLSGCPKSCLSRDNAQTRSIDLATLIHRDLDVFQEIISFTHVAVVADANWPVDCAAISQQIALRGASATLIPVHSPAQSDLIGALPSDADAVYLMPLTRLDDAAIEDLARKLTLHRLPTFSMLGESEVARGVLAGYNTRATMSAFARGTALDVLDAVENRQAGDPSATYFGGELTLNMETAQKLGFSPSWELLTRARLINATADEAGKPIDLESAMRRAVTANLDLAVQERRVAAGAEDARNAKSAYRPHLEAALSGVSIDEDHAMAALGQYSNQASGSITLTQLIYSDAASGNISIQKDLQRARELDWQALRLDIARQAVSAYLNVMRTDAVVKLRVKQVGLTRTNLELARLRRSLGASRAAETYRWEAELATARAGLLDALSTHRLSERQLSRLLDEPVATRWRVRQPDMDESLDVLGGAEHVNLLSTRTGYDQLTALLVPEGMQRAPELAALEAVISAQERALAAARRTAYSPTVALQANLSRILAKDASGGIDLGELGGLIPEFEDTSWNVGLEARLPLSSGGATKAQRIKAREELHALRIDSSHARAKLSQRTLSALDRATASWSTISLRREAADAAAQTLDLVRDAYARGAASILDVLDVQNNALSAELAAVTSAYDFLDDWAEVQRSTCGLLGADRHHSIAPSRS